jgi:hypothetical protein
MLPAHDTQVLEAAPTGLPAEDIGSVFVVGLSERGPVDDIVALRSLSTYKAFCGNRVSYGAPYDWLDVAFREGLSLAYFSRVVGPDATTAECDLVGTGSPGGTAIHVEASSPGDWANDYGIAITEGSLEDTVRVGVTDAADVLLEVSGELSSNDQLVAWSQRSRYVRFTKESEDFVGVQEPTLAGGDDDRGSVTDADFEVALARFTKDLGTGKVVAPARTSPNFQAALVEHAANNNRHAFIDDTDTASATTLVTDALALRLGDHPRAGAMYAPWLVVPGVVTGTLRTVPYSALQAGLEARSLAAGNPPNVAVAGQDAEGVDLTPRYVLRLSQAPWTEDERELLNDSGVNVARAIHGEVQTWGVRTFADPYEQPEWVQRPGALEAQSIAAKMDNVGGTYLFTQIDGRGLKLAEFAADLTSVCLAEYNRNALYGATPEEAFLIDTGPSVNTPDTLAQGILKARVELRTSPTAERVEIYITKIPANQPL